MSVTSVPLRVLRSTSASIRRDVQDIGSEIQSYVGKAVELPALAATTSTNSLTEVSNATPDSQRSESQERPASTAETVFSLDRVDLEDIFKVIMQKEHEPLTNVLSTVHLDVYAAKILHVVLAFLLIARMIYEFVTSHS